MNKKFKIINAVCIFLSFLNYLSLWKALRLPHLSQTSSPEPDFHVYLSRILSLTVTFRDVL